MHERHDAEHNTSLNGGNCFIKITVDNYQLEIVLTEKIKISHNQPFTSNHHNDR